VALEDLLQSQSGWEGRQNCNRVRGITIYNFGFRLQWNLLLHLPHRDKFLGLPNLLSNGSSAITPNPASVGADIVLLIYSYNARVHCVVDTVTDQETIDCIVVSQSSICFLFALSCPLFKSLKIRAVKVMLFPVMLNDYDIVVFL
jgi:hypothetical protein